ncbi:MAG: DEAD/DEAH box helicase [Oceanospirillaceae bacterium]|nr:DEAD/DEAH box helicase [Oceanospirillaceae bacterium]
MLDKIVHSVKGLTFVHHENYTDFIFDAHLYNRLLKGAQEVCFERIVFETLKSELESKNLTETLDYGFRVESKYLYSEGDFLFREFFDDQNQLEGIIHIDSKGLNAYHENYNVGVSFKPKNLNKRPFQTSGFVLKSLSDIFVLTKEQEQAFRAYRMYNQLTLKHPNDHYDIVALFKSLQTDKILIDARRFDSLQLSKVNSVGLNVTQLESGDLKLEPNLLGVGKKSEELISRELGQMSGSQKRSTLHVGKELIRIDEESTDAINEIKHHQIIKKEDVVDFINNPASFIDVDKVDLESGFSFRVNGLVKFIRVQNVDFKPGNNDWFLKGVDIYIDEFEEHINTEQELDEFVERVEDALENNADGVFYEEKFFKIPPIEEFKFRVEEKRKEIQILNGEYEAEKKKKKPLATNVSFKIKYFDDQDSLANRFKNIEPSQSCFENLTFQPLAHQKEAIQWIYSLYKSSESTNKEISGGILADDMGLGKTFSSLMGMKCIIEDLKSQGALNKTFMVVAPLSLLNNWKSEVKKFFTVSPFEDIIVLNAQADLNKFKMDSGDESKQYFDYGEVDTSTGLKYSLKTGNEFGDERIDVPGRLILVSYETLRNYQFSMAKIPFHCVVFDEAQKIKNPNSLVTRAAKALDSELNIIATGTPVENNLEEYWCLMDTAIPKLFGSKKIFKKQYVKPIEKDGSEELRIQLGKELYERSIPFLLRRTKEELKKSQGLLLPKKTEYKGLVLDQYDYLLNLDKELTEEQKSSYAIVRRELSKNPSLPEILRNLHRLRSLVLHPRLTFKNSINHMLDLSYNEFWSESAKLISMLEVIKMVKSKNEKIIIFAISRSIQYLIKKWIDEEFGIDPDIISGDTKVESFDESETRLGIIKKFSENEGFNIVILSPLAAGVGLNVVAANHVFHLERHWNPAKEAQANDRVYRIGQEKDVSIYYPISKHPEFESFDVKLDKLLSKKTFIKDALMTFPRVSENEIASQII